MSLPLVKYVLFAAIRDKLIISMLICLAVGGSLSLFLGSAAVVEKEAFSLVFAASSLRIIANLGLVLFVVFFVRRSFESKDIEFLLSRPVGRISIVFSYAFSFCLLAIFISAAVTATVSLLSAGHFNVSYFLWGASLCVETMIMVAIAFFFSMYIQSAANSAMLSMGVYVLGRMMGQLLGIVDSALVDSHGVFAMTLQLVSLITPRLDLMGQSSWLLYGVEDLTNVLFALFHGVVFIFFVLLAACLDFVRRQF